MDAPEKQSEMFRSAQHDRILVHAVRRSGATEQQAHKKINKYRRRDREEERTYEGGPEGRPNDL